MQLSIYTQFLLKKSTKIFVGLHTRYKMQKQTKNILSQRTLSERDSMVPFCTCASKTSGAGQEFAMFGRALQGLC